MSKLDKPELLAESIKNWDCEDAYQLRQLIRDLKAEIDKTDSTGNKIYFNDQFDNYVDMSALPSADLRDLDDKTDYPIWAMDNNGNVLFGDTADEIETYEQILAEYEAMLEMYKAEKRFDDLKRSRVKA